MKTIDYYMDLPYRLEIVPDSAEGGYVAHILNCRLYNRRQYPGGDGCSCIGCKKGVADCSAGRWD